MKRLARLAGTLVTSVVPMAAWAQSPEPTFFTPPADDTSVSFLRDVFGAVVDTIMSGNSSQQSSTDTVLGAGFQVFCTGTLALAMLFVIYTTIKGAVDTAHDGEFLGKKMSSVWVPLRTMAGTAFLLPLKSGFSLVMIAVLWVTIHGVGLADQVWTAMATKIAQTGMIGRPNIPDSRSLASNILRFEVCAAAMNKQYAAEGRSERVTAQQRVEHVTNTGEIFNLGNANPFGAITAGVDALNARYQVVGYTWDATGGYVNTAGICGSLHWEQSDQSSEGNGDSSTYKGPILAAQASAVATMITSLQPVADAIVAGQKPAPGALERAANAYENTLQAAASQAVNAANNGRESDFIQHAKDGGWIFAGTYYNQIINLNDAVQSAINALPQSDAATIDDKEAQASLITYQDALTTANEYIRNGSQAPKQAYEQDASEDWKVPKSWDDMKRIINRPALGAIHQMTQEIGGDNTSHIAQMKAVGDTVMSTAWVLAGLQFVVTGAGSGIVENVLTFGSFDVGAAMQSISGIVWAMALSLLAAGAFLSYYVAMIPYITWISGLIKWLTMVFESVIASNIWAAAHVHPDGDEQVGRAGPGYMIILSLFMRPTLMVFGLVASIIIAQPIAEYVNLTYITQVQGAMGNSANFLGAMIAYTFIYGLIMAIVLHAVFSLINYVPDTCMRWIGNAIGAHGVGDSEAHEVQNRAMGIFSRVGHAGGGGHGKKERPPGGGGNDGSGNGAGGDAGGSASRASTAKNQSHTTAQGPEE